MPLLIFHNFTVALSHCQGQNQPVLKGSKTFIALAQSFWALCFLISYDVL